MAAIFCIWASRYFYALKVWKFRKQFSLVALEEEASKKQCVFKIEVYIEAWFTVPKAIEAPLRHLVSLKSILMQFPWLHLNRSLKHLWYLSEKVVAFSFFDDVASFVTTQHLVAKLQNEDDEQNSLKKPQYPLWF